MTGLGPRRGRPVSEGRRRRRRLLPPATSRQRWSTASMSRLCHASTRARWVASPATTSSATLIGEPMLPLSIGYYVTILDLGAWGALYTEGWDRRVSVAGPCRQANQADHQLPAHLPATLRATRTKSSPPPFLPPSRRRRNSRPASRSRRPSFLRFRSPALFVPMAAGCGRRSRRGSGRLRSRSATTEQRREQPRDRQPVTSFEDAKGQTRLGTAGAGDEFGPPQAPIQRQSTADAQAGEKIRQGPSAIVDTARVCHGAAS